MKKAILRHVITLSPTNAKPEPVYGSGLAWKDGKRRIIATRRPAKDLLEEQSPTLNLRQDKIVCISGESRDLRLTGEPSRRLHQ
jgi:hypothetical protein